MKENREKYGLFTAITMIIGICIGSGIFFKSDNILKATNGSILLGVIVFVIAALAIVFGGLTFAELAARTNRPGGVVTYMEDFCGKRVACGFGWFQTFIYYPTLTIVVSWVVGVYTDILFNMNATLETQIIIGFIFCTICFIYNSIWPRFGGIVQNATTLIKMLPLALLAILGMIFGDPIAGLTNINQSAFMGASWISAIGPIAFSYDGWTISTSISHEVKNSKRNMPKALVIAPMIILCIYVLYFVGVTTFVGADKVIELGDAHVAYAASSLFGNWFAKAITVFVIISVMGTVNGLVLGFIRMPYSMSLRNNFMPFSNKLSKINTRFNMPINSAIFAYGLAAFWMIVHYLTTKFGLLPNSDVSEISIAISYLLYLVLYAKVFMMYLSKDIKSIWRGVICPLFASVGSLFILSGGMQNSLFFAYALICGIVIALSQVYYSFQVKKK